METYTNPWKYKNKIFPEDQASSYVGFVYQITNKKTGKKYIGKKLFFFTKTRTLKGKKKREKVPSDWKTYYGSNAPLQKDVEELGVLEFKRDILYLCSTKGECSYYEAKEQFTRDVLMSDSYYNCWISCRITEKHLPKPKK